MLQRFIGKHQARTGSLSSAVVVCMGTLLLAAVVITANFTNYARSGVVVFLGAILALTNLADEAAPVKVTRPHCQPFGWVRRLWQWLRALSQKWQKSIASVVVSQEPPVPAVIPPAPGALLVAPAPTEQPVTTEETTVEQVEIPTDVADAPTEPLVTVEQAAAEQVRPSEQLVEVPEQATEASAQPELSRYDTPEQRVQKVSELDFTGLRGIERVAKVLELFPDLSDGEPDGLSNMSAATIKKYRETLKSASSSAPPMRAQAIEGMVNEGR